MRIQDKHRILLTGSSSGIGLEISRALLDAGYRVTGVARDPQRAGIEHPDFEPLALDLSEPDEIDACLRKLCREQDFHGLVHCAGQGLFGSIEQFSMQQIERNIRLNLTSALHLAHHLVPGLRRRDHARMIFIGSESALQAGKKGALYSSAKFGLRGLAMALREDCARDGISVTLINPGMVRSPFFDNLNFAPGPEPSNAIEPKDVADCVLHVLHSSPQIIYDEINLSPRNKSIDFNKGGRS
jgi:short-subunit dehydrogenase